MTRVRPTVKIRSVGQENAKHNGLIVTTNYKHEKTLNELGYTFYLTNRRLIQLFLFIFMKLSFFWGFNLPGLCNGKERFRV